MGFNGQQLLLTLCWYNVLNIDFCEAFRPKDKRKHFISSNSINILSTVNMQLIQSKVSKYYFHGLQYNTVYNTVLFQRCWSSDSL